MQIRVALPAHIILELQIRLHQLVVRIIHLLRHVRQTCVLVQALQEDMEVQVANSDLLVLDATDHRCHTTQHTAFQCGVGTFTI